MSDLESFSGFDGGGEGMDPQAFEKFKERMKAAAAQLKAMQAGEQKQKKTEDELVKILQKFIQSGQKRDLLLLVCRLLEENVPAGFIVSLLLISNPDIQKDLGLMMLPSGPAEAIVDNGRPETLPDHYIHNNLLPLKVKIAIDNWVQEIAKKSFDHPHRVLQTVLDKEGLVKLPAAQLATFCLRDFLKEQGIEAEYDKLKSFMDLMLEGIMKRVQEHVKNQKELKEGNV